MSNTNRKSIFISYSHEDVLFLKDMKKHFSIFKDKIDIWDDTKILAGQKWENEIHEALKNAKVAIFLISADYLSSKFITDIEMPFLLNAAEKEGAIILSVILKPCLFSEYKEVNKYQAINNPSKAISQLTKGEQDEVWVKLALRIKNIFSL